ncbi:MAG: indole-3-glycerol phosphate synthase TrpC [Leptospirales bacterium]
MGRVVTDHPFLNSIVESKRAEISVAARLCTIERMEKVISCLPPPFPVERVWDVKDEIRVIAETKRRSPSRGVIRDPYHPEKIVRGYLEAGASAISVLTDSPFFGGSLDDLRTLKSSLDPDGKIPFLRKDFVIDPYQIWESRYAGADMILLIVRILPPLFLRELIDLARSFSLAALVEVHSEEELMVALDAGASLVGVNHRDLDSLQMNLSLSEKLIPLIPSTVIRIAESGLKTVEDRKRMEDLGFHAVLVGESFLSEQDPGLALKRFLSHVD